MINASVSLDSLLVTSLVNFKYSVHLALVAVCLVGVTTTLASPDPSCAPVGSFGLSDQPAVPASPGSASQNCFSLGLFGFFKVGF